MQCEQLPARVWQSASPIHPAGQGAVRGPEKTAKPPAEFCSSFSRIALITLVTARLRPGDVTRRDAGLPDARSARERLLCVRHDYRLEVKRPGTAEAVRDPG